MPYFFLLLDSLQDSPGQCEDQTATEYEFQERLGLVPHFAEVVNQSRSSAYLMQHLLHPNAFVELVHPMMAVLLPSKVLWLR